MTNISPDYIIREATPDDAAQIIAFLKVIADEPHNGISFSTADEFNYTLEQEQALIRQHAEADNAVWFVAEADGQIIASMNATGGRRGNYGNLSLGITVAKAWRNQGVGTALMQHLIDWCRANPVVFRLHLMVFPNNPAAIHVYEKLGFQHEGVWRKAYRKHGEFLDLMQMAILFEREGYQLAGSGVVFDDDAKDTRVTQTLPGYNIREAVPEDAAQIIAFMKRLADEPHNGTTFTSADQFTYTLEQEQALIQQYAEADNGIWLVAEAEGQIIGHANAIGGQRGFYHTLTLAIAVSQAQRGQGLGTALVQQVIDWCRANPVVWRLHLMVFSNNARAIHVYEKLGFQHEGAWRKSFYKHGEFLDSIQMAILFERDDETA